MKGLLGTVGIILLAATASFAQITFDFTGTGSRAEGMGKAFIGLSDDASAGTWNPAGLIVHEKPILGFGYSQFSPRGTFANIDVDYDRSGSFGGVSMLSFIAPIRIRGHQFVGSASYSKLNDDFTTTSTGYDTEFMYALPTGSTLDTGYYPAHVDYSTEYHSAPYVLNFAFGTKVYKNWAAGLSVNVYTGKAIQRNSSVQVVDSFPDITGTGMQLVTMTTNGSTLDSAYFGGTNFTLGVRHTGERLSAGLIIKTPFSLKYEHDVKSSSVTSFNGLVNTQSSYTVYIDNLLQKYEIPMIIGAGIGYRYTDNLLFAFDVELRQYSGKQIKIRDSIKILPGGNTEETYHSIDPEWNNSLVLRAGMEYMKETGKAIAPIVPLRAGIAYVPLPYPSSTESGDITTPTELAFSLGSGIHWSQIYLDAAYTLSSYSLKGYLGFDPRVPYVEEKATNHNFSVTFTGYF